MNNYNNYSLYLFMDFLFLLLFIFFVVRWFLVKLGGALFSKTDDFGLSDYSNQNTFIDNSVHHHFHVHDSSKSTEIKELSKYVDENFN